MRRAAALVAWGLAAASGAGAQTAPAPPLSEGAWRVVWLSHDAPSTWTAAETRAVRVTLRHAGGGDAVWPARGRTNGDHAVRLGCRWQCPTDTPVTAPNPPRSDCRVARADLPAPLAPGGSVTLTLVMAAPVSSGACRLSFDLVQENVAWFSARGARTLDVAVQVSGSTGGAPPPPWGHAVRVTALGLGALVVLGVAGLAPAALLRSRRNAAWLPAALPALGLVTLSAVGHALAYLPRGTDWSTGPVLALLALAGGIAWRGRMRVPRVHRGALLAAAVGLGLGLWPLIEVGELTSVGHHVDSIPYVAGAERLRQMGMARAPMTSVEDPITSVGEGLVAIGLRQGDQYVLAVFSSLTGLRPHRLFSIVMAVWGTLLPLGIFVFARRALGARPGPATLAALAAALHPLGHYVRLSSYLSQAAGLAVFPFAALAVWEAPRERAWRGLVGAGLWIGALVTFYPVYVVELAPLALAAGWRAGRLTRAPWRAAGRLAFACAAAAALFPYGWRLAARALPVTVFVASGGLGDLLAQGGMATFGTPGVAFGVANPMSLEWIGAPTGPVVALLVAAGLGLVGLALARAQAGARWAALGVLGTLGAAAAHQRLALGFPYGYYKILALLAPFLGALLALGLAAAWRASRAWHVRAGVALLACAFAAVFARQWWVTMREATGVRLVADHAQLELEQARALLPPDAPLLWLDPRWPGRAWSLYLLGHSRNYGREDAPAFEYPLAREDQSPRLIRHALVVRGGQTLAPHAGEPWWDPARHEVLWSNERFALLRRRDGAVAELRFAHPDARVPLRAPLTLELAQRSLRLSGDALRGSYASQTLEWPPDELELAFEARAPLRVWTRGEGEPAAHAVAAGESTLRVPAAARIALEAEPTGADAFLLGVKAVAVRRP